MDTAKEKSSPQATFALTLSKVPEPLQDLFSFLPPPVASLPFLLSHIDFFPLFHFFSFDSAVLVADDSFFPSVSDWYHSHKTFPLFVAAMWHSPSFPYLFPSK